MTAPTYSVAKTLPAPRSLPLIGQPATIYRLTTQPLVLLREHYQRFGVLSALHPVQAGKAATVLAFGAELNKTILSNPTLFHSPNITLLGDSALTRLSSGLVSMNGERHRQQRRLMMPAFHKQAVTGYRDLIVQYTAEALERWKRAGQIHLMPELRQLILRIVSHALFGLDNLAENEQVGSLISRWTRMSSTPQYILLPFLRGKLNRLSEQLERELLAVIERKRAAGTQGQDVLSMLIQAHDEDGARLTDSELIGQLAILFIAGHETTVNALAWTLILLARDASLRLALKDALDGVLHGAAPTAEQAYAIPLLDQVIKESMRLMPPVIYTIRMGAEPFELGGYALAKDSAVMLSHFITHRMPDLYPEPDRFLPQRWEQIDPSPYEYLPFSAGPRMCIGAAFASLEMRLILAMLLSQVQIAPLDSIDYQIDTTILLPKGNVPCAVADVNQRRDAPRFARKDFVIG